ncbi:hypothetical protein F4780DRAFT_300441 [Xylariomycetidae sp. FL0641]|nr:hypothetical protein F4780DRAFT_300441 [Xylariomycetidae sp. FL0641]
MTLQSTLCRGSDRSRHMFLALRLLTSGELHSSASWASEPEDKTRRATHCDPGRVHLRIFASTANGRGPVTRCEVHQSPNPRLGCSLLVQCSPQCYSKANPPPCMNFGAISPTNLAGLLRLRTKWLAIRGLSVSPCFRARPYSVRQTSAVGV